MLPKSLKCHRCGRPAHRVAIFIFGVILLLFFLISITILKGFQSALLTPPQTFTAIQTPTINPTENQVPDGNLENWKTYTDLKWKYQVSYPASWEEPRETHPVSDYTVGFISSDRDSNTFKAETPGAPTYVLYITVYRKTKSTLEEESKLRGAEVPQCALGDPCPPFPPKEIIKKSNSRFKEYYSVLTSSNLKHTIIPLPSDDRYYVDIWTWYTWPQNDSSLYYQILSTFRFLEKVTIAAIKNSHAVGKVVNFQIINNLNKSIFFTYGCSWPVIYKVEGDDLI